MSNEDQAQMGRVTLRVSFFKNEEIFDAQVQLRKVFAAIKPPQMQLYRPSSSSTFICQINDTTEDYISRKQICILQWPLIRVKCMHCTGGVVDGLPGKHRGHYYHTVTPS